LKFLLEKSTEKEAKTKIETRLVYLEQDKKKTEAESKNCHAKTMLSLEKPIKVYEKHPTCAA
jgi:hypothetical protein